MQNMSIVSFVSNFPVFTLKVFSWLAVFVRVHSSRLNLPFILQHVYISVKNQYQQ